MIISKYIESIKLFLLYMPATIKKTFMWLMISYLIPIINVGIIWGIKDNLRLDINVISIILVTNTCFITALVFHINKKRELTNVLNIVTLVVSVVLFSFAVVQIELNYEIFKTEIYKLGAVMTMLASILIGIISKYDEVEAQSNERAKKGRKTNTTNVDGKEVDL